MTWPQYITDAFDLPNGARFYKSALQLNPFAYLKRYGHDVPFADEASYNAALVQALLQHNIEIVAVTDHHRVDTSRGIVDAIRAAGIHVFPGFESLTKDGVHMLCLFDPAETPQRLERVLGDCGIHSDNALSPPSKYDVTELLEQSSNWPCVCIAAHVASEKGLLATMKGQQRILAWTHQHLLAVSLPGPIDGAPEGLVAILKNEEHQHRRRQPIAIINAADVCMPEDLANPSTSCWLKMSSVSLDGLRLAFLDPSSRVRLATDPEPEEHSELILVAWQGGFLDGCAIHFNRNLNVLIGGRGTGKSTVVESVRTALALDPLGDDVRKAHDGIVRQVLRSGTKISLLVQSHRPSPKVYLIERAIPNPPTVRDETGSVLPLHPTDVIPGIEVYGQHEISELTKSPERLTRLLDRFIERDPSLVGRKTEARQQLERSRTEIVDVTKEIQRVSERLAQLPLLEETLKRFQQAGLEERLKEQSLLIREERILATIDDRLSIPKEFISQLEASLPIDTAFLSSEALADLPSRELLSTGKGIIEALQVALSRAAIDVGKATEEAQAKAAELRIRWNERKKVVQEQYEGILRDLQRSKVDGDEFIQLRRQIEQLSPLRERQATLEKREKDLHDKRRTLLVEWEDVKAAEFQQLDKAAKRITAKLRNLVRIRVAFGGNREPLLKLLKDEVGGRLSEALSALDKAKDISLRELADAIRAGAEDLGKFFQIPLAQAERLAQAPPNVLMAIEEIELPHTTHIELNIGNDGDTPVWRTLDELSTGQKATAVLLLLLLESAAPLVVDQPEDDLDNRFIADGIVPRMREEKRRRQFLFASHNANIPVLGDAELIVGLEAAGEASEGRAQIPADSMGSIDLRPIRELVEEVLEGGKEAFETRRVRYGF